jgi:hypothetical protein
MKEYALRKIEDGKYYLFCLSFDSILNYLRDLVSIGSENRPSIGIEK